LPAIWERDVLDLDETAAIFCRVAVVSVKVPNFSELFVVVFCHTHMSLSQVKSSQVVFNELMSIAQVLHNDMKNILIKQTRH